MKLRRDLITGSICFFGAIFLMNNNLTAQGNSNGNSNSNNNANPNALKWETQGNQADTTDFIGTTNPTALKFRSDNVERLRITEDGRIGIGTTEPTKELEVLGNTMLRGDLFLPILDTILSYNNEKVLYLDANDKVVKGGVNTLKNLIYADHIGDLPASICDIGVLQQNPVWNSAPYKLYSRCPDVKVGIGTHDPQFLLHTEGTGYFKQGIRLGTISTPGISAFIEGNHTMYNSRPWMRFTVKETDGTENTAFLVQKDGGLYCTSVRVRLREDMPVPDYVFKKDYPLMPL